MTNETTKDETTNRAANGPQDGNGRDRGARTDPRRSGPGNPHGWRPIWAAFALFFIEAFSFASWLPRLPELKAAFALSDGDIGLVLLALPVGLLMIIPLVGYASTRVSLRTLNVACLSWMFVAVTLIGLVAGPLSLALVLFLVGMGGGAMGVAMNAAGFAAEGAVGRPILSRCHAFFSLGFAAGGLSAGVIAAADVPIFVHLGAVNAALFGVLLVLSRFIVEARQDGEAAGAPAFARPTGALLVPGLIAMGCLMAEGVAVDWSSIYLAGVLDAPAALVGAGVATFSGAMALMRFAGDWLTGVAGDRTIVGVGAAVSAAGYALTAAAPSTGIAFAGLVLVGLGLAPIVPLAFRLAGRLSPTAPGVGVAAVSTLGYVGFLLGPPLVGLVSEASDLRRSFAAVAMLLVGVAVLSTRLRPRAASE